MSKYDEAVLKALKKDEIKSTKQILDEVVEKTGKKINWYVLYRILHDFEREKKVEKLKAKAGFFWRKL